MNEQRHGQGRGPRKLCADQGAEQLLPDEIALKRKESERDDEKDNPPLEQRVGMLPRTLPAFLDGTVRLIEVVQEHEVTP